MPPVAFRVSLILVLPSLLFCNPYYGNRFLYFAYGSNLLAQRIHIKNPSAVFFSAAKLKDYRLDFSLTVPSWRGAVATIVEEPGSAVWGALWTLDISHINSLDEQEGVHLGWYYPKNVTVITGNGKYVFARTYQEVISPPKIKSGEQLPINRRPSITYLQVIILGAYESGLPPHYIGYLYTFPTNGKLASKKIRKQLEYPFDINLFGLYNKTI